MAGHRRDDASGSARSIANCARAKRRAAFDEHVNIAMWSGPRNISTAMMYSFGNRPDCFAWDEPFYGFALKSLGHDHPMREEIIAGNDCDWDRLVARCLAPAPNGAAAVLPEAHDAPHAARFRSPMDHAVDQCLPDPLARARARELRQEMVGGLAARSSASSSRRRYSTWSAIILAKRRR